MKKLALTLITVITAGIASAAVITPEQALSRAQGQSHAQKMVSKTPYKLVHTVNSPKQVPAVYIFSKDAGQGYLILSADDLAMPVLGYADSGSFDADNMPQAMRWWLDEYARRIDYANTLSLKASDTSKVYAPAEREAIEPMLKTQWDQVTPFNDLCPMEGTNRTYTGCVATSIAQVMKYWEYPEVGQGTISYNDGNLGKRLSMDFSKRAFDWGQMIDNYTESYTPEQADAVAYLMRAAAFSVKMNFSSQASSAYALNVADGMIKYFKYDGNALYAVRSLYSPSQWDDMIYDNLKNVGPVIYGGTSMMGGGHSFVCDGYDGKGYYHFNWGWSGMSNGYFLLDALVPANLGAGGGAGGGYNFSQDAVLGIQPPTGEPVVNRPYEIVQAGSLLASVDGSVLSFALGNEDSGTWLNYNPVKLNVTFGVTIEPQAGGDAINAPLDNKVVTLSAGYGTSAGFQPKIDLAGLNLPDGTYKVTFATNIKENGDAGWLPVHPFYGYYNYVTLTKAGDTYTVKAGSPARLRVVDADIVGTLYYGCMAKVQAVVANDSDEELTCGLAPVLYYQREGADAPQPFFLGGSQMITVAPHSQYTHQWATELQPLELILSMNYEAGLQLTFFDESTYTYFTDDIFKTVMMKPNPGIPDISLNSIRVIGGKMKLESVGGQAMPVWVVTDKLNIEVEYTTTLSGTIPFAYQMIACLLNSSTEDDGSMAIYAYNGEAAFINPGDGPYKLNTVLSYAYMQPEVNYYLTPAYLYGSNFLPISNRLVAVRYVPESGVEGIVAGDSADADSAVYNLQGVRVASDTESLPKGIYIQKGKKIVKR